MLLQCAQCTHLYNTYMGLIIDGQKALLQTTALLLYVMLID